MSFLHRTDKIFLELKLTERNYSMSMKKYILGCTSTEKFRGEIIKKKKTAYHVKIPVQLLLRKVITNLILRVQ